ncbi:MAG: oligoendopeptidase F [Acidobacteriota bacterium]
MSRPSRLRSVLLAACLLAPVAVADDLPAWTPDPTVARAEIPDAYKWDLSRLFADDAAFERELVAVAEELPRLDVCAEADESPSAEGLERCLETYFELHRRANRLTLYANLRLDTAQTDDRLRELNERALGLMRGLMARAADVRRAVLALDDDALAAGVARRPRLRVHAPYIANLRRRADRVLGPEAERVLSLFGDNLWAEIDLNELPSDHEKTFQALLADMPLPEIETGDGRRVPLTLAGYARLRADRDRATRRAAVARLTGALRRFEHAYAATLGGQARLSVAFARARGYERAREAYLDKDAIDSAVFDTLVTTVRAHLAPLHRYVALRRRVLGLDKVHLYDMYVPLVAAADRKVPFAEARRILPEALAPLGPEVGALLREGLDPANGWIDVYPHRDKASGAFSASAYGIRPYIKLNYQDSVDDLSTLAHEFGHAVHSVLAMDAQPYSSFRYVPFLAEIASTCNEALLSDWLIAHARDDAERAALLAERAETIRTTIYRQVLFAEFEDRVHRMAEQGTPITAEALDALYRTLIAEYYGPDYALDADDGMEWAYVPHFYYKFYVFTYATGLSSGIAIAERVRTVGEPAVRGFLAMLRGGSSAPPLELLRRAGVDLTRPDAIEAALRSFDGTVRELERLLVEAQAEAAGSSR